jgi:hypothetical protein
VVIDLAVTAVFTGTEVWVGRVSAVDKTEGGACIDVLEDVCVPVAVQAVPAEISRVMKAIANASFFICFVSGAICDSLSPVYNLKKSAESEINTIQLFVP